MCKKKLFLKALKEAEKKIELRMISYCELFSNVEDYDV